MRAGKIATTSSKLPSRGRPCLERTERGCEGTENTQGPTANAMGPTEPKQSLFFDREKEWIDLYEDMEGEEAPGQAWPDDAEAVLPEEPNQDSNSTGQEPEEPPPLDEERPPEESPALRRRWSPPPGRSEPPPLQMKIRVADEVLTVLAEAALENEHIDKAMAEMGIAQNLKEYEKCRRGTRERINVNTIGTGASGALAGNSKTKVEYWGAAAWMDW